MIALAIALGGFAIALGTLYAVLALRRELRLALKRERVVLRALYTFVAVYPPTPTTIHAMRAVEDEYDRQRREVYDR